MLPRPRLPLNHNAKGLIGTLRPPAAAVDILSSRAFREVECNIIKLFNLRKRLIVLVPNSATFFGLT